MKKRLCLLALTFTLVAPWAFAADVAPSPIKIGLILPLSGNNANLGEFCLKAVALFKKDLADPALRHRYELIIEDDQLTPRLTAQAAQKLLNIDHVHAIVTFSSGSGSVVAPLTEQKKIPHISIASDIKISSRHTYSFLHWIHPHEEVAEYFKLLNALGIKRLAMITARQSGALYLLDELRAQAPAAGVELTSVEYFNTGERDFRIQLLRLNETRPDALLPLAFSPELQIILRRLQELGIHLPLPSMECYDFLSGADAKAIEGQYYISAAASSAELDAHAQAQLGEKLGGYCVPQYYTALSLLREAFESAATLSPEAARTYLASLQNHPTLLGRVSCDAARFISSPTQLFQFRDGGPTPVSLDTLNP